MSSIDYGPTESDYFMLSPMIGPAIGARLGRTVRIALTPGFLLSPKELWTPSGFFPMKFRFPTLHADIEWTFYREFGLFLRVSYARIYSDGGHRAGILQLFPAFIYKTDF
jgi:hypothetical protein